VETALFLDKNIELAFSERGCPLGFKCHASGIGQFEVCVYDDAKMKTHEIAHLIGGDERAAMPDVVSNELSLPNELLADLYHMARCRREMKRVGTDGPNYDGYENGYKYHRERFLKSWKERAKPNTAKLTKH
jgi:hypothetical protein